MGRAVPWEVSGGEPAACAGAVRPPFRPRGAGVRPGVPARAGPCRPAVCEASAAQGACAAGCTGRVCGRGRTVGSEGGAIRSGRLSSGPVPRSPGLGGGAGGDRAARRKTVAGPSCGPGHCGGAAGPPFSVPHVLLSTVAGRGLGAFSGAQGCPDAGGAHFTVCNVGVPGRRGNGCCGVGPGGGRVHPLAGVRTGPGGALCPGRLARPPDPGSRVLPRGQRGFRLVPVYSTGGCLVMSFLWYGFCARALFPAEKGGVSFLRVC